METRREWSRTRHFYPNALPRNALPTFSTNPGTTSNGSADDRQAHRPPILPDPCPHPVDPCPDRSGRPIAAVPVDRVAAGTQPALGQGAHSAPGGIEDLQAHLLGLGQIEAHDARRAQRVRPCRMEAQALETSLSSINRWRITSLHSEWSGGGPSGKHRRSRDTRSISGPPSDPTLRFSRGRIPCRGRPVESSLRSC